MPFIVKEPGFYQMDEADYHADCAPEPSLSRSLAQTLVEQSPLHAYAEHPNLGRRLQQDESTEEMEFGTVVHTMLLGRGQRCAIWDETNWRGGAAAKFWDDAIAAKQIPILKKNYLRAVECVDAVREKVTAFGMGNPFDDSTSELKNETVAVWKEGDIWLRARMDAPRLEQLTIHDVKTTSKTAHPKAIANGMKSLGYDMQDEFYTRGVGILRPELRGKLRFIFWYVETKYPYAVVPAELNGEFKTIGMSRVMRAMSLWGECLRTNKWPGYTNEVVRIEPKPWDLMAEFGSDNTSAVMARL